MARANKSTGDHHSASLLENLVVSYNRFARHLNQYLPFLYKSNCGNKNQGKD